MVATCLKYQTVRARRYLTKLQRVFQVSAPVSSVWSVLTEPAYAPKLYPDIISLEMNPPGRAAVGQTSNAVLKAGKRKLEVFTVTTEIEMERKSVLRNRPGGLFEFYERTVLLEPKGHGTEVTVNFDFRLSMGYVGKTLNPLVLETLVTDNLKSYAHNLKEISELLPLPQ